MTGNTNYRRFAGRLVCTILPLAVLFWTAIASQAWSQNTPAKTAAHRKELSTKKNDIMKMLRDPEAPGQEQLALFDEYFNDYFFAACADPDCLSANQAVKLRSDLRNHYFGTCKNPALYAHLTDLCFAASKAIVLNKSLPAAARYNAMLVLGELNEEEAEGKKAAKPLKTVLPLLYAAVRAPKIEDYLKVAALVGIQRQVEAKAITPEQAVKLQTELLKLIRQQEPPLGRSLAVHSWLQRSAAEILGEIETPGPDNVVVSECGAVINNAKAPLCVRCAMAECLGRLKIPSGAKIDFKVLANDLGYLAVDICKTELEMSRLKDVASKPRQLKVKSELLTVRTGLVGPDCKGGLAAATTAADQKNFIDAVAAKLKNALKSMEDEGVAKTPDALVADLTASAADFESVLMPRGAAQHGPPPQQGAFVGSNGASETQKAAAPASQSQGPAVEAMHRVRGRPGTHPSNMPAAVRVGGAHAVTTDQ